MNVTKLKGLKVFFALVLMGSFAVVTAASVIQQRQAEFDGIKDNMKAVSGAVKTADRKAVAKEATEMAAHFAALQNMFPKGSQRGDTDAAAKIWRNFNGFTNGLKYAQSKASALAAAANSNGDMMAALRDVGATCKACHREYRKPKDASYKNK